METEESKPIPHASHEGIDNHGVWAAGPSPAFVEAAEGHLLYMAVGFLVLGSQDHIGVGVQTIGLCPGRPILYSEDYPNRLRVYLPTRVYYIYYICYKILWFDGS